MTLPKWAPNTSYANGALVVPASQAAPTASTLDNANLSAATGWDLDTDLVITTGGYGGEGAIAVSAAQTGEGVALNQAHIGPLVPGQKVSATAAANGASSSVTGYGTLYFVATKIRIAWYNSSDVEISHHDGGYPSSSSYGQTQWSKISASANAPAGVSYCRIGAVMKLVDGNKVSHFALQYTPQADPPATMFQATQAAAAFSGLSEPTWPAVDGTVVDGGVTWTGVAIQRITWTASPRFTSDTTEPVWPTTPGGTVNDGTIGWVAYIPSITDPNCPNSAVVAIASDKVFAADGGVVRFCATTNALDWSAPLDAGFLPTGVQQAGVNDVEVLALYRGDLIVFNASSFQRWHVDPDPTKMALIDTMDGLGSRWQRAAQSVAGGLFFLTELGVRSVSVSTFSDNLEAGDVGTGVDRLVRPLIGVDTPISTYYPGAGQYWLVFDKTAYVLTLGGKRARWGKYVFPFAPDNFAQLNGKLYIRHGDTVSVVDESVDYDEVGTAQKAFDGIVQWPWLAFERAGRTKMMQGLDVIGSGNPFVSIGYDESDDDLFTWEVNTDADTPPGGMIAMPVAGPSFSVKLRYEGGTTWRLDAVNVYLNSLLGQP